MKPPFIQSPDEQADAWLLIFASVVLLMVLRLALEPWVMNHDAALHLDIGRMILEGKRPYLDFVDTNPPMIMYLSVVPAAMAKLLPIHIISAFHLFTFCLMLISAGTCRSLLARARLGVSVNERNMIALTLLVMSFALMQTPDMDWGQREHLYLLLYFPFFICRWVRWQGGYVNRTMAIIVGLAAAAGACMKPHFVIAALSVEGAQIIMGRRAGPFLKPEWITFVLGGLFYALHFLLLPGEIREAFFGRWLPMVAAGYDAYNQSWSKMIFRPGLVFSLISALAGIALGRYRSDPLSRLADAFAVFGLVSLALYLLQHKGWFYHQIPAVFGGTLALVVGGFAFARKSGRGLSRLPNLRMASWLVAGVLLASGVELWAEADKGFQPWPDPGIGKIIQRYSTTDDPILIISTQVGSVYPLMLQVNRASASRYITTFPLALIYAAEPDADPVNDRNPSREHMKPEEIRFLNELEQDIRATKPPLILIDARERPQAMPEGFTFPDYFEDVGFLKEALGNYRYEETAFDFQIYVRNGVPSLSH